MGSFFLFEKKLLWISWCHPQPPPNKIVPLKPKKSHKKLFKNFLNNNKWKEVLEVPIQKHGNLFFIEIEFLISICCFLKCGPNFSQRYRNVLWKTLVLAWTCFLCKNQIKTKSTNPYYLSRAQGVCFFFHMNSHNYEQCILLRFIA
jgi:hypothetical protein